VDAARRDRQVVIAVANRGQVCAPDGSGPHFGRPTRRQLARVQSRHHAAGGSRPCRYPLGAVGPLVGNGM